MSPKKIRSMPLGSSLTFPVRKPIASMAFAAALALFGASTPSVAAAEERAGVGRPVRIVIPSIRVDAAVERVGLAVDGSMDVPKRPKDVAWYGLGPKPGETGSAVVAGHLNWFYGASGAFERLRVLRPGDLIEVKDDRGSSLKFKVREIRDYDAAADATEVFTSQDGKAHLNLVTCSGAWDKLTGQYSGRLVVFADMEVENDVVRDAESVRDASDPGLVPAATICASGTRFTTFLTLRYRGTSVLSLQRLLQCLGYFPTDFEANGNFGSITAGAVKKFQSANGIAPFGYVGPATRAALNRYQGR